MARKDVEVCVFQRPIEAMAPTIGLEEALRPVMSEFEADVAEALSSATGQVVAKEEVILDVIKAPPAKKSEGSVLLKGLPGAAAFDLLTIAHFI